MKRRTLLMIGTAVGITLSCEAPFRPPEPVVPPQPPPPGLRTLRVQLATPHSDDGAIVLEIRGLYAASPKSADSSIWLVAEGFDSMAVRVVVAGDLRTGPLLTFTPASGLTADRYTASVIESADRAGTVRSSVDGYTLTITP